MVLEIAARPGSNVETGPVFRQTRRENTDYASKVDMNIRNAVPR